MTRPYSPFGLHRVISPPGALPQAAEVLDPRSPIGGGEVLIDVERLNLDAASFHQLREEQGGEAERMRRRVRDIVRERGKMHNPVTGSGGMLIGTVEEVGPDRTGLRPGDRIATLVSLTLTPLVLEDLSAWDGAAEQVPARGRAILFESSPYAVLPEDLPPELCLAVLDVAGAPAWVRRLAKGRRRTVVIGAGGKSGLLSMAAARGLSELVAGLVPTEREAETLRRLGFVEVAVADARDTGAALAASAESWDGPADLVVNCVNVPGTEGITVLLADEGGTVLFFSMATSFAAAALIAEGLGKDLTMLIGTGYVPGHAELALEMVRSDPALRAAMEERRRALDSPGS
jgi:L-erythro-3,5-diaminohexanoate dehydrogenase